MKKIFLALSLILLVVFSTTSCDNKNKKQKNDDKQNTEVKKQNNQTDNKDNTPNISEHEVIQINTQEFKELIFDFENNQQWNYQGTLPCVVDFYADWCRPCKIVAPIMEELAKEYKGKVIFYRVNVDNEGPVSQAFGIQSIPSILFVPASGDPQMSVGAMQKEGYENAIKQIFSL